MSIPPSDGESNATGSLDQSLKSSTVRLSHDLRQRVAAECAARSITTGDLVIDAIETTYERLPGHLHPAGTVGGKLFSTRGAGTSRAPAGESTQLAFTLRIEDFEIIAGLVRDLAARSQAHLITAALSAYFDRPDLDRKDSTHGID